MKVNNQDNSILKTENLSIGYRSKKEDSVVASHINFKLQQGQLIGLVGANGIGKSTLLKTLIKAQNPLSGNIYINQQPLEALSYLQLAQQLSVVLTQPIASKNMTVLELVALGRQPYSNWIGTLRDTDINATQKAIDLVGITDLKYKKCYQLSDGQLQNVMIARALAQDTPIIILDEPTTHLDMYHKAYVLKLLKTLTRETGKTILFSSHEIQLAIQLCDTMLVMTNEAVVYDQPYNLVSNGIFESLFPKDLIAFDAKLGSFKVNKD